MTATITTTAPAVITDEATFAALKAGQLFEYETCGRCLGSGTYSWNAIHGDRCYGCGGTGSRLTRAGKAARAAWTAAWTTQIPVGDLEPGQKVIENYNGRRRVHTVAASHADELNAGRWMVRYEPGGTIGGHGFCSPADLIELPATCAEKLAAYRSIAHLRGAVAEVA